MTARLLMIGLDAADGTLLDRWCADGTMPNLAAIRRRGAEKRLTAPPGITDDGVWASFQYGDGLGGHGRYTYTTKLSSGKFGMAVTDEGDRVPFWRAAGTERWRTAIFDVPKCPIPAPFNGIQLLDWLVHGKSFSSPQSYPEALAAEVVERFGTPPPSRCSYHIPALSDGEIRDVAANLRRSTSMKAAAALHYLKAESWDLFVAVFKEAHCSEHTLWDLIDPAHGSHEPGRNERLGEPVREVFRAIDRGIGDLVAAAGAGSEIVVFSTSDFAPNGSLAHLMPAIAVRANGPRPVRGLRRLVGLRARRYELLPFTDNAAALRIHAELGSPTHKRLRQRLERMLGELIDLDTGHPVFVAFSYPSAEETGPRARTLPDLLAHSRPGSAPRKVGSPRLGRFEGHSERIRPGNHVAGGRVFAAGRGAADAIDAVETFADLAGLAKRLVSRELERVS